MSRIGDVLARVREALAPIRARLAPITSRVRVPRALKVYVGYPLWFLGCLLLFAYWTFPYDRVRDFIIQEVEYPAGPGGARAPSGNHLEIVDLSPSWVTGVELTGVRLEKLPEDPEQPPVDVAFEHIHARVSLLALLTGTTEVSFDAKVAGGDIEGTFSQGDGTTAVEATIDQLHLRRLGPIRGLLGIPIVGTLSGAIDLRLPEEVSQTAGSVHLDVAGLSVGDGNAKLKLEGMGDGLTIETMDLGALALRLEVAEGVARLEELSARGPDAELAGSGNVRLLRPLAMSRPDILLRVKFADTYKERNDRTRGLFSLLELNPRLRAARTPDGAIQYRIGGTFAAPRPTAAGRAGGPAAPAAPGEPEGE